jgi:hypothetical protein
MCVDWGSLGGTSSASYGAKVGPEASHNPLANSVLWSCRRNFAEASLLLTRDLVPTVACTLIEATCSGSPRKKVPKITKTCHLDRFARAPGGVRGYSGGEH